MALDWLLDPVTPDLPCGPNLEKIDDPAFLDYYYEAEGRLPDRYYTPGVSNMLGGTEDQVFEPRSVLLKQEREAITALLTRSRDLRLLGLLARFQILAARPADFADTLEAMAALITERKDEVHPQVAGSVAERRGALDALSEQTTVVMPLIHLPLLANADVTYRAYMVASGTATPRASEAEETATPGDLIAILRNPANAAPLSALFGDLSRAALALTQISTACRSHPVHAFSPDFTPVLGTITDLQSVIREALPGLTPWSESATPDPEPTAFDEPTAPDPAPLLPEALPQAGAVGVKSHAQARAVILAAEGYLATHEPSSLSLLLVTQARLLVGKSLVEAIELLRPQEAESASFSLGRGLGFALDMSRLRSLAQSGPEKSGDSGDAGETKPVTIGDRGQLASCLRGVEEFYLRHEPASPVPVLLGSARNMLTKTFDAILGELLPQTPIQVQGN